jgi:hypothetical protein
MPLSAQGIAMKTLNITRSKKTLQSFFESVNEPVEAVHAGHSYIAWPAETVEFLARAFADPKFQEGLRRSLRDIKNNDFVEIDVSGGRIRRKSPASRPRAKSQ